MANDEIKKMIVEELEKNGLSIAEDAAVNIVKVLFGLIPKVVSATENKYDDLLLILLPAIQPTVMEALDRINGKKDL
jgi:hypothetical protein